MVPLNITSNHLQWLNGVYYYLRFNSQQSSFPQTHSSQLSTTQPNSNSVLPVIQIKTINNLGEASPWHSRWSLPLPPRHPVRAWSTHLPVNAPSKTPAEDDQSAWGPAPMGAACWKLTEDTPGILSISYACVIYKVSLSYDRNNALWSFISPAPEQL